MKIAFIDRDGTLIFEPPDTKQIDSLEKLQILPGVMKGLGLLQQAGFQLCMVSNQDGLGSESFPIESFEIPHQAMLRMFAEQDINFDWIFICPHTQDQACSCRKPRTGLIENLLCSVDMSRTESFVIGDRNSDRMFAQNIGVRFIPMETNGTFPDVRNLIL